MSADGREPRKEDAKSDLSETIKSAWAKTYEVLHSIYISIQIYEILIVGSSIIGAIIAFVHLDNPAVIIFLLILLINIVVLIRYARKYRNEHAKLEAQVVENQKLADSKRQVEGAIQDERQTNRGIVARFTSASAIASTLADRHSDCDRALFDELNAVLVRPQSAITLLQRFNVSFPPKAVLEQHRHVREAALYLALENVKDTLEQVCIFLKEFTGETCNACIKTYDYENAQATRDATVFTHYRNYASKADREANQAEYKIYQNTVTATVFVEKIRVWACDDLKREADEKKDKDGNPAYVNARPNWRRYYNATAAVGIRDVAPSSKRPFAAVLCVDNSEGRLNNAVCLSFLLQVSARLAVMLYRVEQLQNGLK